MKTLLRRWFRCRHGQHRETLDMHRLPMTCAYRAIVVHDWYFRCVDCGERKWFAYSDNIDALSQDKWKA